MQLMVSVTIGQSVLYIYVHETKPCLECLQFHSVTEQPLQKKLYWYTYMYDVGLFNITTFTTYTSYTLEPLLAQMLRCFSIHLITLCN